MICENQSGEIFSPVTRRLEGKAEGGYGTKRALVEYLVGMLRAIDPLESTSPERKFFVPSQQITISNHDHARWRTFFHLDQCIDLALCNILTYAFRNIRNPELPTGNCHSTHYLLFLVIRLCHSHSASNRSKR